jgi:hypothetical protein
VVRESGFAAAPILGAQRAGGISSTGFLKWCSQSSAIDKIGAVHAISSRNRAKELGVGSTSTLQRATGSWQRCDALSPILRWRAYARSS